MTSGTPDRLATCTCTIAWVESIIHVDWCCAKILERGDIPGHTTGSPVVHKRVLLSF